MTKAVLPTASSCSVCGVSRSSAAGSTAAGRRVLSVIAACPISTARQRTTSALTAASSSLPRGCMLKPLLNRKPNLRMNSRRDVACLARKCGSSSSLPHPAAHVAAAGGIRCARYERDLLQLARLERHFGACCHPVIAARRSRGGRRAGKPAHQAAGRVERLAVEANRVSLSRKTRRPQSEATPAGIASVTGSCSPQLASSPCSPPTT